MNTIKKDEVILRGDEKTVKLYGVDLYEVAGQDGITNGYTVGAVYAEEKVGKTGEYKRSELHAFERLLRVLKVDALQSSNFNKYTKVFKTPAQAAKACDNFAARFAVRLGRNAEELIKAGAVTAEESERAAARAARVPKTAEEIISAAYEKAANGEKGRAGAAIAAIAAINPADVPAEIAASVAATLRDIAAKVEARATATATATAETADNEHGDNAPTTCNGVRIVGYVMPGRKGNRRHGVELEDGTVIYDGTPEWTAAIWA